jgi:hypothetical protein
MPLPALLWPILAALAGTTIADASQSKQSDDLRKAPALDPNQRGVL